MIIIKIIEFLNKKIIINDKIIIVILKEISIKFEKFIIIINNKINKFIFIINNI